MKQFLTAALAFALLLSACVSQQAVDNDLATPTAYPTPIKPTFTAQRGDIAVDAKLFGRVSPLAVNTVFFAIKGQVGEVYANIGDVVKQGQLLGELAEAREIRNKAEETQRTIRRAQIDLEIAQLTLQQMKTQGRSETEIKIQELQVELAQMKLDETLTQLGIDPNITTTDQLEAQVLQAQVFAPADGTVIARPNVGRNVTPTTPAFLLGDPNKLEVVVDLDPTKGDQVKEMFEGMPVSVTLDTKPDVQLNGIIRQLPSPYGTGESDSGEVHIVLDTPPSAGTYQNGDKVTVTIRLAFKQGVIWLPPDAIRSAGGRTFVIINSDSGPKRVDVQIGLQTRDRVEIVAGLEEGQVVVGP